MASNVGNIKVKLNLDSAAYEHGINSAVGSIKNLSTALGALGVGFGAVQLVEFGKSVRDVAVRMDGLINKFNAAASSENLGGESLRFVREESKRLGLAFIDTADAFAGFEAATLRSGLTLEQTKKIFTNVSEAVVSLHLSSERSALVFRALEQMASKGVVSMEELRRQLGDSLPGAFEIAAKSMGVTTQKFNDMVSSGEVMSADFLPKFAAAIKQELGQSSEMAAQQANAAFNRLGNSIFDVQETLGNGLNPVLAEMATKTSALLDTTNENIQKMKEWAAVNQGTINTVSNVGLAIATTAATFTGLYNIVGKLETAYSAAGAAIAAVQVAQEKATYTAAQAAVAEAGLYDAIQMKNAKIAKETALLRAEAIRKGQLALEAQAVANARVASTAQIAVQAEEALYAARLKGDVAMIEECATLRIKTSEEAKAAVVTAAAADAKVIATAKTAVAAQTATAAELGLSASKIKSEKAIVKECIVLQAETAAKAKNAAATAAATKVTASQYFMTGNFIKAIKVATASTLSFTTTLLANPWTLVAVGIAGLVGGLVALKHNAESTQRAIEELNGAQDQQVDKTSDAIKVLKELDGAQNLNYEQTKRLDGALTYLTEKYPNYIGKLREELKLKGQISKATAEQIANEMTLAKVKGLKEARVKLDKDMQSDRFWSNLVSPAGALDRKGGRYGVTKSNQKRDDALIAERKKLEAERQSILNELSSLNVSDESSSGLSGSAEGKKKKGKTASQLAAEEKRRLKEILDYKIALLDIEKVETLKTDEEIYQIELKQAELRIASAKKGTSEYAQALAAKLKLERDHEKRLNELKTQSVVDSLEENKRELDNKIAYLELAYEANKISKARMLEAEVALIQQKKNLESEALKEQLKLVKGNAAEEVKIKRTSNRVIDELNREEVRKNIDFQNEKKFAFKSFSEGVSSEWGNTIGGLIKGEKTFSEAINSLGTSILNSFGNVCGEMVTKWMKATITSENISKAFAFKQIGWDKLVAGSKTIVTKAMDLIGLSALKNALISKIAAMTQVKSNIAVGTSAMTAASSLIVALTMPIIAISTTVVALSSMLATLGLGMLNGVMAMTAATSLLFAPVSLLLASEFAIIGAAAKLAATAVAQLAIALAAASAAAIPLVGWAIAPAAATMTGAAIMAANSMVQFREKGGPVKKGQPYVVGEKRPELFVPDRNGTILPDTSALNGGGGSSNEYNLSVVMPISSTDVKSFEGRIDELTDRIHSNLFRKIRGRKLKPLAT